MTRLALNTPDAFNQRGEAPAVGALSPYHDPARLVIGAAVTAF